MTTRAVAGHRHIDVKLGWQPVGVARLVTGHAGGDRGRNMVGRFSCCRGAVVAARAIGRWGETAVVRMGGREPCGCFMASVTRRLCRQMIGQLPWGDGPVVTSGAGADDDTGVVELRPRESRCVVTGFTSSGGRNVLWRLDNVVAGQTQPTCMAGRAILRGPLEYSFDVTRFTPSIGMPSRQSETRLKVIKFVSRRLRHRGSGKCRKDQRDRDLNTSSQATFDKANHGAASSCFADPNPPLKPRLNFFQLSVTWHCSQRTPNCPSCTSSDW